MPSTPLDLARARLTFPAAGLALTTALIAMTLACQGPAGEPSHESWACRNDLEVRCDAGGCEAETGDAFTPMDVRFDGEGTVSACAYSGCWEGEGEALERVDFLVIVAPELPFSTAPDPASAAEDVVIVLDRTDGIATLKVGEFAHPLRCESAGT